MVLFGCPDRSAAALWAGVLPLRYCSARFACKLPTWRLPDRGRVRELVTESVNGARASLVVLGWVGIYFLLLQVVLVVLLMNRVLGGFKRIRLNRRTPAHFARVGNCMGSNSRSRVWKRLRVFWGGRAQSPWP